MRRLGIAGWALGAVGAIELLVACGAGSKPNELGEGEITRTTSQADGTFSHITGTLQCSSPNGSDTFVMRMAQVPVSVQGMTPCTGAPCAADLGGQFSLTGSFSGPTVQLNVVYDGPVTTQTDVDNPTFITTPLQVMDDFHATRTDSVTITGTPNGDTLDLGPVTLATPDCEAWRTGEVALDDYHFALKASPPAGQLRILRWSSVVVGQPYTYYDYVNLRSDWTSNEPFEYYREKTLVHESAHTVRHVLDGDQNHWNCDDFSYDYGRIHDGTEITNVQYAFNEGWADFWAQARHEGGVKITPPHDASLRDWNEFLVANQLLDDASLVNGDASIMVQVLKENRWTIHSLDEFEQKFFAKIGRQPPQPPPTCPPGFTDDGLTCRRDVSVVDKPSYGRGVGSVPDQCGAGQELDAGLCYAACAAGYHGVGPVCWGTCPPGYNDDGLTCRRDAQIIGADNSNCPWYDECGLTFAKGCSTCPPGYANDGCTCRIDVDIFVKPNYGRGVGTVPDQCGANQDYDAGLCYPKCNPGYHGVGPVCWGTCPPEYQDQGGTCYRGSLVFVIGAISESACPHYDL